MLCYSPAKMPSLVRTYRLHDPAESPDDLAPKVGEDREGRDGSALAAAPKIRSFLAFIRSAPLIRPSRAGFGQEIFEGVAGRPDAAL